MPDGLSAWLIMQRILGATAVCEEGRTSVLKITNDEYKGICSTIIDSKVVSLPSCGQNPWLIFDKGPLSLAPGRSAQAYVWGWPASWGSSMVSNISLLTILLPLSIRYVLQRRASVESSLYYSRNQRTHSFYLLDVMGDESTIRRGRSLGSFRSNAGVAFLAATFFLV